MILKTLRVSNFMGLRDYTLDLRGASAEIRGTNAVGKTTLFSAFAWLLFGKDSAGRADFDIKTLDEAGEAAHNLEHTVEGAFEVGDASMTLRKTLVEVWTRKRGSTAPEFTGHRVDHFIDDVPLQKKQYEERIAEIAPEGVFRLLTDPDAFHALHWKEKRSLLLDVCGDVSDDDVISAHAHLKHLPGILGKRSIDEYRKVAHAARKKANEELERIPVRVEEVEKGKPEAPESDRGQLDARLEELRAERSQLEEEKARTEAGGQVGEKQAELRDLEGQLHDAERAAKAGAEEKADEARRDARAAAQAVEAKAAEISKLEIRKQDAAEQIQRHEQRRDELRAEWQKVNARAFSADHDQTICPACGQELPADQIEAAHAKALEEFNAKKAAELERIQADGMAAKGKQETLEREEANLAEQLEVAREEYATLAGKAEQAEAAATKLEDAVPDPAANPEAAKIRERIESVKAEIEQLRADASEAVEAVAEKIRDVDAEIEGVQASVAALEQINRADERIEELASKEAELAAEFERLGHHLHLLDEFTRAKATMLTERINSRFAITNFRLFDQLIHGGLQDTCVATVNGVPYGTGLNRAARINSGLDVLRVLQEHYAFYPPVWVDECESVVETLPLDAQVIKLVVDERHHALNVQLGTPQEVAA